MNLHTPPPRSPSRPSEPAAEAPSVSPVLPLLLLETMRDHDRPEEVLEEEDISLSMPRRLGLSEVVRVQIVRFTEEVRQKRPQIASQVEDLFRLVIRRPDAEEILLEAGERIALRHWEARAGGTRRFVSLLPRPLKVFWALGACRRMLTDLVGPTRFRITRKPPTLRIERSMSASADPGGAACALYAGAFGQILELYTGRNYHVVHVRCRTRDATAACEWVAEVAT